MSELDLPMCSNRWHAGHVHCKGEHDGVGMHTKAAMRAEPARLAGFDIASPRPCLCFANSS